MVRLVEALKEADNPSVRHIVNVSGGKDSSALAIYLKLTYPNVPYEYVFCDTGCELPETYEYLERLEAVLGSKVIRLTALDKLKIEQKLDRNPFDILLNELYGGFLPSPKARWCTQMLKIKPFEHYVGNATVYSYIGIRHDENREGYKGKKSPVLSQMQNIIPVYPFKDDEITLERVESILELAGIGMPEYYKWRSRSGCYFCFYQQKGEWQNLKKNHPELYEKAKKYEKTKGDKKFTWREGQSLEELEKVKKEYSIKSPEEVDGCAICHL